jgi:hypothetical protein
MNQETAVSSEVVIDLNERERTEISETCSSIALPRTAILCTGVVDGLTRFGRYRYVRAKRWLM